MAYQALMVVLAMTGLAVGVLVSEQQRTQHQLRINQEALNRALRARAPWASSRPRWRMRSTSR